MGEKVKRGIKLEDGSYTYYYDRSSSLGGTERKNLITGNTETKSYPKKKMPGKNPGKVKTLLLKPNDPNRETKLEKPLFKPNDPNRKTGLQFVNRKSGSSKAEKKKMPKARDMAMGNKNIVYLGDPYMVDGKMYDPVKSHPEDYIRPKDAKTYSSGGEINVGKGGDYIKDLID